MLCIKDREQKPRVSGVSGESGASRVSGYLLVSILIWLIVSIA